MIMDKLTQTALDYHNTLYRLLDAQTWCPKPILWLAFVIVVSPLWGAFALVWCARLLLRPAR